MRFCFFTISVFDPDALNTFCAQLRIVASSQNFVDRCVGSFWVVCVTWAESAASPVAVEANSFARRASGKLRSVAKHCGRMNSCLRVRTVGCREAA